MTKQTITKYTKMNTLLTKKNILIFILICVPFYILNVLTPEFLDDYGYKFIYLKNKIVSDRLIENFSDILISQYNHYMGMNGRAVVHTVAQLFCGIWGKGIFNVFNSIVFFVFVYSLVKRTGRFEPKIWILVTGYIWLLFPLFNNAFLWMTGSINYLWTGVIILYFISLYSKLREKEFNVKYLPLILPGILIGWTHEGASVPLGASLFFISLYNIKSVFKKAYWPLVLGFGIGCIVVVLSPGILSRMENKNQTISLIQRIPVFLNYLYLQFRISYVLLFAIVTAFVYDRKKLLFIIKENMLIVLSYIFALGSVFAGGEYSMRAIIWIEFYALLFLLLFTKYNFFRFKFKTSYISIPLLMLILGSYIMVLRDSIEINKDNKLCISQMKSDSNVVFYDENLVFNRFSEKHIQRIFLPEFAYDKNLNEIKFMCKTYHKEYIQFIPLSLKDKLQSAPEFFDEFYTKENYPFIIRRRSSDLDIERFDFTFNPINIEELKFYEKPLINYFDRYRITEYKCYDFKSLTFSDENYDLILKPAKLIDRLKNIDVVYKQSL